jgi:arylsulfatase A-like enzyme
MDNGSQRPYISQENTQRVLETRYRNSVAWVDSLLGEFFDALKTSGRLERSVVIITGDHGEAFWEHGSGTHGSNLMSEQLEVAFAMHLPKTKPGRPDCIFSLMDVMPSILTEVGIPLPSQDRLPGTPLQQRLTTAEGKRPGSALTFQGWNERAFRFALSYEDKRILYELSNVDPTQSQKLLIKRIYSLDGNQEILGKTCDAKASRQCMSDLPRMLEVLPFLEME